jgi:ubiquinone/menaquinone biosynthesis C-methylase UbiE
MSHAVLDEADRQGLELFLSDFEDDIRFCALQISRARKTCVVEQRDVQEASRRLPFVLLRPKGQFRLYKKILADLNIIEESVKASRNFRVLDAGCGWGRASRRIGRYLGKEVEAVGVDLNASSLKYGQWVNPGFSFVRSSMDCLPFKSGVFKVVASDTSLHEVGGACKTEKAIGEFGQVLGREGVLWILDEFELCYVAKLVRRFLRRVLVKVEPYSERSALERIMRRMGLRLIRKERVTWSPLNLGMLCSYVAVKT